MQDATKKQGSWWRQNRACLLCLAIPFAIFFGCGATVGWWLIDKDAGRYLRDHETPEPATDFYYASIVTGLAFGAAGAVIGITGYGGYRLIRRVTRTIA